MSKMILEVSMAQSENVLEDLMTAADAARALDLPEAEVRALLADGSLAGRQVGGRWFTTGEAVEELAVELDDDEADDDEADDDECDD